ncbi:MAG TPA: hypothetical protein VFI57_06685, partial [Pyrinomonadaceae bacterium]|nr:hypothetical protein [Pyrinomonadaceae bacterium]
MFGSSDLMDLGITVPLLIIATLKGTIMLAVAGVAAGVLKNRSAAVRHVVWCAALLSLLVFFVGANGLARWQVPILPATLFAADVPAARPVTP